MLINTDITALSQLSLSLITLADIVCVNNKIEYEQVNKPEIKRQQRTLILFSILGQPPNSWRKAWNSKETDQGTVTMLSICLKSKTVTMTGR
ncbi:hypothetical protein T11_11273 [Trichinella zimbabwensis]|uniref:PiggyBac transposable element-derived protein domain-containing protein n=1 Tax=Trichinella zimbabwensis TaxID=268475 RepID=A0A0V1HPS1_9BILA|nr:hypothetical protein T11_11273 [Trichinella zimbabwensis]